MCSVELYVKIRRVVMVEGRSEREVARYFGIHRNTAKKMCQYASPPGYRRESESISPKLAAFTGIIDAILGADKQVHAKQRHTTTRILQRLRDEHSFTGGYTIVRNYVYKAAIRQKEMFMPLVHLPGHAQTIQQTFAGFHLVAGRKKTFFVKSAMISFMIPKILSIFPAAKFVHVYRFGPSVVRSYFEKNYGTYSKYKFSEEEYYRVCAKYWNSCILEIERVKDSLSLEENNAFLEFSYESLCDNPSDILKRLSNFMEINYDMFTFDKSSIKSTNYKVAGGSNTEKLNELIFDDISPAMKLKGYNIK